MTTSSIVRRARRVKSPGMSGPDAQRTELGRSIDRLAEEFAMRAGETHDHQAASIAIALHLLSATWSYGKRLTIGVEVDGAP